VAKEIERKYLVLSDAWREQVCRQTSYRQGYLMSSPASSVRVRIGGGKAHLNIKSATVGATRLEFEYPVPLDDAETMLRELCDGALVEKTRYEVEHEGRTWEVDVFEGDNAGLVVAEIELEDEAEEVPIPPWAGEEVTDNPRYYNACLVSRPYRDW
jgi:adenylate cyclase